MIERTIHSIVGDSIVVVAAVIQREGFCLAIGPSHIGADLGTKQGAGVGQAH